MPPAPEPPRVPPTLPALIATMAALGAAAPAMTVVHWTAGGYSAWQSGQVLAVAVVGLASLLLSRRRHRLAAGLVAVLPLLADALLLSPSSLLSDSSELGLSLADGRTASEWLTDLAAVTAGTAAAWLIMWRAAPDMPRRVRSAVGLAPVALYGLVLVLPMKWSFAGLALTGMYFDVSLPMRVIGLTVLLAVLTGGAAAVASVRTARTDTLPLVPLMAAQLGSAALVWGLATIEPSLRDAAFGCRPRKFDVDTVVGLVSLPSHKVDVTGAIYHGTQGWLPVVVAVAAVLVMALARFRSPWVLPPLLLLVPAALLAWDATTGLRGDRLAPGGAGPNCGPGEEVRITNQTAADVVDAVAAATYTIMPLLVCLSAVTACALAGRRKVRTPQPRVGTSRQ
jgi:hypothetical protein